MIILVLSRSAFVSLLPNHRQALNKYMNLSSRSRVLIQGIDSPQATEYALQMKAYGTKIAAGISAGLGGETIAEIPVFDLVEDAIAAVGKVEATLIFVHPYQVLDAAKEALAAKIPRIILLTNGVPPLDLICLLQEAKKTDTLILGPGSSGIIIPEKISLGKLNPELYTSGKIGVISSSESLAYEVVLELNRVGLGQSFVVTIGNEPMIGSSFQQWLTILATDTNTEGIVLIGQPDSSQLEVANYCRNAKLKKPVIAYLVGLNAPKEKIYRDATTIIANQLSYSVSTDNKDNDIINALKQAGVLIAKCPSEIPVLLSKTLSTEKLAQKN
ncbi:CoA-binding domain protein [Stanieria sp. NIES-3757]|nr:CoA-binding domain protein [Stanieria sp. NIES-3757]